MSVFLVNVEMVNAQSVSVKTQIQCNNQQGEGFLLTLLEANKFSKTPYDDAALTFVQGLKKTYGLQLIDDKKGGLFTQKIYNVSGGGQLTLAQTVKIGSNHCGRAGCHDDPKTNSIVAKVTTLSGQNYVYSCN